MLNDDLTFDDREAMIEDIQAIQASAEHLRSLVSDTLDLAKIESGKLLLDIDQVSLHSTLKEIARTMHPAIANQHNRLVLELDEFDADHDFETDNLKLRQILLNLLSNAAKFTTDGTITMRAVGTLDGPVISVSDDGIGMSTETVARVWDEFVQADETALSQNGGTGLGLALVKQLTELLDGRIDVESVLGEGTTFTIALPHSPDSNNATSSESLGA